MKRVNDQASGVLQKHSKFLQYLEKNPFLFPQLNSFHRHILTLYLDHYIRTHKRDKNSKNTSAFAIEEVTDEILPSYIVELISHAETTIQSLETMLESFLGKEDAYQLVMDLYKVLKRISKGKIPEEMKQFEREARLQEQRDKEFASTIVTDDVYIPNKKDVHMARKRHWEEMHGKNIYISHSSSKKQYTNEHREQGRINSRPYGKQMKGRPNYDRQLDQFSEHVQLSSAVIIKENAVPPTKSNPREIQPKSSQNATKNQGSHRNHDPNRFSKYIQDDSFRNDRNQRKRSYEEDRMFPSPKRRRDLQDTQDYNNSLGYRRDMDTRKYRSEYNSRSIRKEGEQIANPSSVSDANNMTLENDIPIKTNRRRRRAPSTDSDY